MLSNLPGYEYLKGVGESLLGVERHASHRPVLVRLEEAWQIAFLVERLENGHVAVFVPGAPNPRSGSVYFMTPERIREAGLPVNGALKCLRRVGAGSGALLRDVPLAATSEQ